MVSKEIVFLEVNMKHKTMLQGFEWYLAPEDKLWIKIKNNAKKYESMGVTSIWLPPAYKGHRGCYDSGYGVYDLYDLGEFDQKGSVETKYGSRQEYLEAIQALKDHNIAIYVDVVLNHRIGADELETVLVDEVNRDNRNEIINANKEIKAWTKFTYPNRNNKYSTFKWDKSYFKAIDFDDNEHQNGIYLFKDRVWDEHVSHEYGNYDYLLGADVDVLNPVVMDELKHWLHWYYDTIQFDGVRLDAIKHIDALATKEILESLRDRTHIKAVGEYWSGDIEELIHYHELTEGTMALFDVPLHHKFHDISTGTSDDLSTLYHGTFTERYPEYSVTFVDNHDTQIGQSLESWVEPWFRNHANAFILLHENAYPCLFYTDMDNQFIQKMIAVRSQYEGSNFVDIHDKKHTRTFGYTDENGYIVSMSINGDNIESLYIGQNCSGTVYFSLEDTNDRIIVDENGYLNVPVKSKEVKVYIQERVHYDFSVL